MAENKFRPFDQAVGKTREVGLCTPGKAVTIREITGEDEDTLTLIKDQEDGVAIPNFVSSIIVDPQVTPDIIQHWRARDKYLILFEGIRLTYGDIFRFEYEFKNGDIFQFEENISRYVWDFSKDEPPYPATPSDSQYFRERIVPYLNNDSTHEFKLSSGEVVGFEYLTGVLESASLMIDPKQRSLNDDLRDRNFYVKKEGTNVRVDNFRIFGGRAMAEIRKTLQEVDPPWPAKITLKHPKTGEVEVTSLFGIPDFFIRRLL